MTNIRKDKFFFNRRFIKNTQYSLQGLISTFKYEEAFRIEIILTLILVLVAFFISENYYQLILLIIPIFIILIVEILNSAVESVVDRVGSQKNELSGRAKDQGSAAVFLSICLFVFIWTVIVYNNYF